jgi:hypothetical protein
VPGDGELGILYEVGDPKLCGADGSESPQSSTSCKIVMASFGVDLKSDDDIGSESVSSAKVKLLATLDAALQTGRGFLKTDGSALAPSKNDDYPTPHWTPTYNMSESTIVQPCNYSGLYNPHDPHPDVLKFGLVDYDWSNAKQYWANESPMDCDAKLLEQAARNKAQVPTAKVFIYRNLVLAMPWYKEVGQLLEKQENWGWFVPYKECLSGSGEYTCKNPKTGKIDAASNIYHDQEQSPGWTDPNHEVPPDTGPDGVCQGDTVGDTGKGCDCGKGVACGKHLWNHKNGSMLRDYLVNHHIASDLKNKNVDGYYLDDYWSEAAGPSEEAWPCTPRGSGAGKCSNFTGQELKESVGNWSLTMKAAQAKIRSLNGFDWQSFRTLRRPLNSSNGSACSTFMRSASGLVLSREYHW